MSKSLCLSVKLIINLITTQIRFKRFSLVVYQKLCPFQPCFIPNNNLMAFKHKHQNAVNFLIYLLIFALSIIPVFLTTQCPFYQDTTTLPTNFGYIYSTNPSETISYPADMVIDSNGNIYISFYSGTNQISKLNVDSSIVWSVTSSSYLSANTLSISPNSQYLIFTDDNNGVI